MQVQFLIDKKSAGADHVVGWTVLRPGARHESHRHHNCDEFFIVLKGSGTIYTDDGEEPSGEGDVVYSPRGCWHGFNNTSDEDVVLVWGWMGAGSIEASGYEVHPESHKNRAERLGRSAHRARHEGAAGAPARAPRRRRRAARLEGRLRRAGAQERLAHHRAAGRLSDAAAALVESGRAPSRWPASSSRWPSPRSRCTWARILPAAAIATRPRPRSRALGAGDRARRSRTCRPTTSRAILAGNIYQRHVLLGPRDPARAGCTVDGLTGRVFRRGAEAARTSDPQANTGKLVDIVRHVADLLAAFGERLRAGEIIITGSVVAPLFARAGRGRHRLRA